MHNNCMLQRKPVKRDGPPPGLNAAVLEKCVAGWKLGQPRQAEVPHGVPEGLILPPGPPGVERMADMARQVIRSCSRGFARNCGLCYWSKVIGDSPRMLNSIW